MHTVEFSRNVGCLGPDEVSVSSGPLENRVTHTGTFVNKLTVLGDIRHCFHQTETTRSIPYEATGHTQGPARQARPRGLGPGRPAAAPALPGRQVRDEPADGVQRPHCTGPAGTNPHHAARKPRHRRTPRRAAPGPL